MQTILAVDDEASVRQSYRIILSDAYRVVLAENGETALDALDETYVDLILLDLLMPGIGGMEFLDELAQRGETIPVIVVTALNSVASAVEAMKRGARDYIIKPFDVEALLLILKRVLAEQREKRELRALREAGAKGFDAIVGESPALMDALALARQAMQVDSTVLITGESGTGKDLVARAIHSGGKRAKRAFVSLSCCAIPAQLVESELFGHEKGAFTGAIEKQAGKIQAADGGTLFLDEIGEISPQVQTKLLRVLQDGSFYPVGSSKLIEVDIRVICATNRDLRHAIANGDLREDLFYRINVLAIEMPPLRRRREDIPALVRHFVAKHAPRLNVNAVEFSPQAMTKLTAYAWPGNVRELENVLERVLVYHGAQSRIQPRHLAGLLPSEPVGEGQPLREFEGLALEEATIRLERHLIKRALARSGDIQSRAAELLGTTRRILKYKMDQLGIGAPAEADTETGAQSD